MASCSKKSAARTILLGKRDPGDNFGTKPFLKKHKENSEEKETTDSLQQIKGRDELLETKANLISVAVRKKTLFVRQLSPNTKISHIINFFKDVGQVFRVRLMLDRRCKYAGCGFVEFDSSNEAKKALERKNGEYLLGKEIILEMAKIPSSYPPSKYCIEHKVWRQDHESLLIEQGEIAPDFAEAVLFVANLSPQTKMLHVNNFFKNVGEVKRACTVCTFMQSEEKNHGYVDYSYM